MRVFICTMGIAASPLFSCCFWLFCGVFGAAFLPYIAIQYSILVQGFAVDVFVAYDECLFGKVSNVEFGASVAEVDVSKRLQRLRI